MDEISIVRSGQSVSAPLTEIYPNVVSFPLGAFLLHEDAKHHLELELDEQTAQIVGSNRDIASGLAYGFQETLRELSFISESMNVSNETLQSIDNSLDRVNEQLVSIETAVNHVADTIERVGLEIVRAVNRAGLELAQINQTATLIADTLKGPELAWAREQAKNASRAMQVGDLLLAEQSARRALDGFGPHTGAPTHVELMLLLVEVYVRVGNTKLAEATASLSQAQRYLALEPSSLMQARYQFALGSLQLLMLDFSTAATAFIKAAASPSYFGPGHVWNAVAQSALNRSPQEIAGSLAAAIEKRPQIAIEVWRRKGEINEFAVDLAIIQARDTLFLRNDKRLESERILSKAKVALDNARKVAKFDHSYSIKVFNLEQIIQLKEKFLSKLEERFSNNTLMSAFLLQRDVNKHDRELERWRAAMET